MLFVAPGSRDRSTAKSYNLLTLPCTSFCKTNTVGNAHDGRFLAMKILVSLSSTIKTCLRIGMPAG